METSDWIASGALVIAIAAAAIAWWVPHQVETKRQASLTRELKIDGLRRVVGLRAQPPTKEWVATLNEIAVTFNDSEAVLAALRRFDGHIQAHGGHSNQLLVELFTAMMGNVGLNRSQLDGEFPLRPFRVS